MSHRFLIVAFFLMVSAGLIARACDVGSAEYSGAMANGCQSLIDGTGGTAGMERCCYLIKQTSCVAELTQAVASKINNFSC